MSVSMSMSTMNLYITVHFGVCDSSSVEYLKVCVNLNSIAHLIDRKRCKFMDSLMSDVRFSNLLLVRVQNSV